MKTYGFDQPPATQIAANSQAVYEEVKSLNFACLIGPNNSGKSFVLKRITEELGGRGTYLGPARYSNFNTLTPYKPQKGRKQKKFQEFINSFRNNAQNIDNSPFNIQQAIAELDDARRDKLFEIVEDLMGAKLQLAFSDPSNKMSQMYVSADGHNFSFVSSGTRLIVSILTSLLDQEYSHFLIDEPELGVSPEAQAKLAEFVLDDDIRTKHFPHIESVIFATHSTIFLNRADIGKNFVVNKAGDEIFLSRLSTVADFNRIHFSLLGNSLQKLFLPDAIVFVEGPTEQEFFSRCFALKYPNMSFSIINATNDSEMKRYAHMMLQIFPDLQHSPYKDRIFPILDVTHGSDIISTLDSKGIPLSSIIVWSKNGIEHFYPRKIMDELYGAGGILSIICDEVSRNGTKFRKTELAARVAAKLTPETDYHDELVAKLFAKIDALNQA